MANLLGIAKQVFGNVIVRDIQGNERSLKVGDELMLGETVVTLTPDAKAVIATPDGSEITILGNDEFVLDQSLLNSGSNSNVVADISDLQNSILEGQGLQNLEETAAGGGTTNLDGTSLGAANFTDSGKISNVFRNFFDLDDTNNRFASGANNISGDNPRDTTKPNSPTGIEFTEDANKDGTLNDTENGSSKDSTGIKITLPTNIEDGSKVVLQITNPNNGKVETKEIAINADAKSKGYVEATIPVQDGKVSSVDAIIQDKAGNSSDPVKGSINTDTTKPNSPTGIEFTEDANKDGTLNDTENGSSKDSTGIKITLPTNIEDGSKVVLQITNPNNGKVETKEIAINADAKSKGYVEATIPVQDGKVSSVDAIIQDKAGNSSDPVKGSINTDTTKPNSPTGIEFTEDANKDGTLNDTENGSSKDSTGIKITLPTNIEDGSKVVLQITNPNNGKVETKEIAINADAKSKGYVEATIPVQDGKVSSVDAIIQDKAGNSSDPVKGSINTDTTKPNSPTGIEFTEDANKDGTLNDTENGSSKDSTGIKITLPTNIEDGSKVVLQITNPNNGKVETKEIAINADAKSKGYVEATIPVQDGKVSSVDAIIQDKAGNSSDPVKGSINTDTTKPNSPTGIEFTEDANKDGTLNDTENGSSKDSTGIKITLPTNIEDGSKVVLQITNPNNGKVETKEIAINADAKSKGYVEATIPVQDGKVSSVDAIIQDKAGNSSDPVKGSINTDTTKPNSPTGIEFTEDANKDGTLNDTENGSSKDSTGIKITLPTNIEDGSKVVLQITNPNNGKVETKEIAINADAKSKGYVEATIPVQDGKVSSVDAIIQDKAGNSSDPVKGSINTDTTKPNSPTGIEFTEDANKDGTLNDTENGSSKDSTGIKITLPTNIEDGSKVVLQITNPNNGKVETKEIAINADAKSKGYVEATIPVQDGKVSSVDAIIQDKAGNSSDPVKGSINTDTTKPNSPTGIEFTEDANKDGTLNDTENGSSKDSTGIKITLPTNIEDGSKVVLQITNPNNGKVETKEIAINADAKSKGYVEATIPVQDGKVSSVDAIIQDKAGNSSDPVKGSINTDTTKPNSPTGIEFTEDANKDGTLNDTENGSSKDSTGIKITLPTNIEDGSKVVLQITNPNNGKVETKEIAINADAKSKGYVEATIPVQDGKVSSVDAIIQDKAGNSSDPVKGSINTDTTKPNSPTGIEFTEDANKDGTLNDTENGSSKDSTGIKITLPTNIEDGSKVVLQITNPNNGKVETKEIAINADAKSKGYVEATIPVQDGKVSSVDAIIQDKAGNSSDPVKGSINTDTTKPNSPTGIEFTEDANKDGTLNDTENGSSKDSTGIKITLPTNIEDGSKVVLQITNPNNGKVETKEIAINADAKSKGYVEATIPVQDGKVSSVDAIIQDKAGNSSDPVKGSINTDTTKPNSPTGIEFTEDANKDGTLNDTENGSSKDSTGIKITLPTNIEDGSKVVLQITNPNNGKVETKEIAINADAKSKGYVEATIPVQDGKVSSVDAIIQDKAGNSSDPVKGSINVSVTEIELPSSVYVREMANYNDSLKSENNIIQGESLADNSEIAIDGKTTNYFVALNSKTAFNGEFNVADISNISPWIKLPAGDIVSKKVQKDNGVEFDKAYLKVSEGEFTLENGWYINKNKTLIIGSDSAKALVITNETGKDNPEYADKEILVLKDGDTPPRIFGGDNTDDITIDGVTIDFISTGTGNDNIVLKNGANIAHDINTGDGKDNVVLTGLNTEVKGNIFTGAGDDIVDINNSSKVGSINSGAGNDSIKVDNATVEKNIYGRDGDDNITLTNATVQYIEAGKGAGKIDISKSEVLGEIRSGYEQNITQQGDYWHEHAFEGNVNLEISNSTIHQAIDLNGTGDREIHIKDSALKGTLYTGHYSKSKVVITDSEVSSINKESIDDQVIVQKIDAERNLTIDSIQGDKTIDLSKVSELDKNIKSIDLSRVDSAKLNITTQDVLDINQETGKTLIIKGDNMDSVKDAKGIEWKAGANVDGSTTYTETGTNTVSIVIDNDIDIKGLTNG
ncbi:hypothetical protein [Campylobacter sp. RM16192]|uniref:hypothetical protein n=1 Tax=Campylobacter sp. RM16192 TaxID=1660080 RepID=UPI00145181E3|nr:hypothetical protein [Campylobacter sp. RM16192]QCD51951.1 hypothetical protein CDOMC_0289 [Campylobacter sp. RM16192]